MKPQLIILVGLPRSGKSTWAARQSFPIVCPDTARLAIHGQRYLQEREDEVSVFTDHMVEYFLRQEHAAIVIDATHTTKKRRDHWLRYEDRAKLQYVYFATSEIECLQRADDVLKPVIRRMAEQFEPLTPAEAAKVLPVKR